MTRNIVTNTSCQLGKLKPLCEDCVLFFDHATLFHLVKQKLSLHVGQEYDPKPDGNRYSLTSPQRRPWAVGQKKGVAVTGK